MNDDKAHQPSRRLAVVTYSGLAVVGLAGMLLIGGANAAPGAAVTARLTSASTRADSRGEPPFATRAESRRLARRLLGRAVLPPGSRRFHGKAPYPLGRSTPQISAFSSVDLHKIFVERGSMRRTYAFLRKHHLAGWKLDGTGYGFRTVGGKQVRTEEEVSYTPERLPAADSSIVMDFQVVPGRHGHALTEVDVQVIYYPRRSAAEHLTARDFRAVTVEQRSVDPHVRNVTRTFRQRAIVDRLTRVLNSRPASPGGLVNCPAIRVTWELRFRPVNGQPAATVWIDGCYAYAISVGGHSQPALSDNGNLERIATSLLRHHPARHRPAEN